ncbi:MAG: NADP-dependent succinic semialdehyde dehydrogenase [Deltaproteobacteria bacterium HGW-Deltaproteobacteria-14]|jgi:succinate-semialdehyde dehydrogenase/glutarate-semialdehyde dehydrogenase|nr:MAG: NADP-dependent succinic semialdehyde dehydrogenase [Deltaproteobacteria bacterium HGW-Deltaproteobacteria-14]
MELISVNPATGKELSRTQTLSAEAVEAALSDASAAFRRWRATPIRERANVLSQAARLLEADAPRLAALMSSEMGKPFREAIAEAKKCAWTCRHYAENAERYLADQDAESDGSRAFVRYQPLGPVLAIMPWNFPFWQVFRMAAPALAAGNVVLCKHAPSTSGCGAAIASIWRRAGAPGGVYQDLPVAVDQVPAIIADPRVVAVAVTGSTRAGRAVAAEAGRHLKRTVLELGGSDPAVVMPTADLDKAVEAIVRSRTLNNGQSCIATKRVIVHEAVADAFTGRLVAAMQALAVGDPMDESVHVGPLASAAARELLAGQVAACVAAGARVHCGGKALSGPGYFYPPTVLGEIPRGTPAWEDELFGPVASVFRVRDLDAAIALANDTVYGLGAAVYSRDEAEIAALIDRIDAGCVFVNGLVKSDPRLPFGGIKSSGWGRELGALGIRELCNAKTVWIA